MSLRLRLSLALLLIIGAGFYFTVRSMLYDLRPRYLSSMEEVLIDVSEILAGLVSEQSTAATLNTQAVETALQNGLQRDLSARVYRKEKTFVNMHVYICNAQGTVVYASSPEHAVGSNYARWNDVYLCLQGKYGARATRSDPSDPASLVLYVAAPIAVNGQIVGSLTVCKPSDSVAVFIGSGQKHIIMVAIISVLVIGVLIFLVTHWVTHPLHALERVVQETAAGQKPNKPQFTAPELEKMSIAIEDMRQALDGKQYIEQYVQQLTHEFKSPLSVIAGANELLQEDMSDQQRQQFLHNIDVEVERLRALVDRILLLANIENQPALIDAETIDLSALIRDVLDSLSIVADERQITFDTQIADAIHVSGDRFLLELAIRNILTNAIDFSDDASQIRIALQASTDAITFVCADNGAGIPEFALERIYERFYSLQRPHSGRKSSGLGLSLVREITHLHQAALDVSNRQPHGVQVTLRFQV